MSEADERIASGWDARAHRGFVRFLGAIAAGDPKAGLLREDGVVGSICPRSPDRSLFNSVAYEDPAALEASIESVAAAYGEAGIRAWTVWVPESDRRTPELLADRGHKLDGEPRSMLLDLAGVPEPGEGEELDFTRAAPWEALCAINDVAYDLAEGTFEAGLGSRPDSGFRAYGAAQHGWLASVLGTLLDGDDCGVTAVATLPEARGRRLAGRLLHRALLDAREHGCATSTLQSSAMGAPVYRRLGYRDLGGLQMWEHRVFPS